jgi:hypothetical protein
MAVSAQFELSSLGKPLDELLPADTVAVKKQGVVAGKQQKKTAARQHPM